MVGLESVLGDWAELVHHIVLQVIYPTLVVLRAPERISDLVKNVSVVGRVAYVEHPFGGAAGVPVDSDLGQGGADVSAMFSGDVQSLIVGWRLVFKGDCR